MEGPLSKWTNVIEGWQYRWFVLDETAGILTYYTVKKFRFFLFGVTHFRFSIQSFLLLDIDE